VKDYPYQHTDDLAIIASYLSGMTMAQAATLHGCSTAHIPRVLRRNGVLARSSMHELYRTPERTAKSIAALSHYYADGNPNPNWKGGRTIEPRGYVLVKRPDHPSADVRGYVYEHRLVMEQSLGRLLDSREQVHHLNMNPTDNRIENLMLCASAAEHKAFHRKHGAKGEQPSTARI
jgi:hypothetical protein